MADGTAKNEVGHLGIEILNKVKELAARDDRGEDIGTDLKKLQTETMADPAGIKHVNDGCAECQLAATKAYIIMNSRGW